MTKKEALRQTTQQNNPATERHVLRAARYRLGASRNLRYQADFEHGQWWVTELGTGRQWSVADCETAAGVPYFDFEQVSQGDHDN